MQTPSQMWVGYARNKRGCRLLIERRTHHEVAEILERLAPDGWESCTVDEYLSVDPLADVDKSLLGLGPFVPVEVSLGLDIAAIMANENSKAKGFWPSARSVHEQFALKIALAHSELSEALEKHRKHDPAKEYEPDEHCPDFSGIVIEFADAIIRILDLARALDMPIGDAVLAKMKYNETRPPKHGKAY